MVPRVESVPSYATLKVRCVLCEHPLAASHVLSHGLPSRARLAGILVHSSLILDHSCGASLPAACHAGCPDTARQPTSRRRPAAATAGTVGPATPCRGRGAGTGRTVRRLSTAPMTKRRCLLLARLPRRALLGSRVVLPSQLSWTWLGLGILASVTNTFASRLL